MAKILVIEEQTNLRRQYRQDLELEGYKVVTAPSKQEGLQLLEAVSPDLVILDVQLADLEGVQAMDRLMIRCPRVPVLLNSVYPSSSEHFLCWAADAYVRKSIDTRALRTEVKKLLAPDAA